MVRGKGAEVAGGRCHRLTGSQMVCLIGRSPQPARPGEDDDRQCVFRDVAAVPSLALVGSLS